MQRKKSSKGRSISVEAVVDFAPQIVSPLVLEVDADDILGRIGDSIFRSFLFCHKLFIRHDGPHNRVLP